MLRPEGTYRTELLEILWEAVSLVEQVILTIDQSRRFLR